MLCCTACRNTVDCQRSCDFLFDSVISTVRPTMSFLQPDSRSSRSRSKSPGRTRSRSRSDAGRDRSPAPSTYSYGDVSHAPLVPAPEAYGGSGNGNYEIRSPTQESPALSGYPPQPNGQYVSPMVDQLQPNRMLACAGLELTAVYNVVVTTISRWATIQTSLLTNDLATSRLSRLDRCRRIQGMMGLLRPAPSVCLAWIMARDSPGDIHRMQ